LASSEQQVIPRNYPIPRYPFSERPLTLFQGVPVAADRFEGYIRHKLRCNSNVLIFIRGPTGSGKSWSALKLCEQIDSKFSDNPADRICFTPQDFLTRMESLPRNGFLLWDEMGVFLGHRKWLSDKNQLVVEILQSFRFKAVNLVFTAPSDTYVDKVARELVHRIIELPERLHRDPPVTGTILKMYDFRGFKYWSADAECPTVRFFPPTRGIIRAYEDMREEKLNEFYAGVHKKMDFINARELRELNAPVKIEKSVPELAEEARGFLPDILSNDWREKLDNDVESGVINMHVLKQRLSLSQTKAYDVRQELLRHLRSSSTSSS